MPSRGQNDRTHVLYSGFERQGPWDTWRSFLLDGAPFRKFCATQAKMTAKCPMDLDVRKLSRVHVYDHFDPYMAHFARGHKKLQRFWCNFAIF